MCLICLPIRLNSANFLLLLCFPTHYQMKAKIILILFELASHIICIIIFISLYEIEEEKELSQANRLTSRRNFNGNTRWLQVIIYWHLYHTCNTLRL